LFALYAGAAIALAFQSGNAEFAGNPDSGKHKPLPVALLRLFTLVFAGFLAASCYLLIWNFNSLKLQRLIKEEMNRGSLKLPADKFLSEFPPVPDINVVGEPVAVQKARYLMNEKRYRETINILIADHSSPYDTRKELFISKAYFDLGKTDSAMIYASRVYEMKPRLFDNNVLMAVILEKDHKYNESAKLWSEFLSHTKNNGKAWAYAAGAYERSGDIRRAFSLIDSALMYVPSDTLVQKNHRSLFQRFKVEPYKEIYQNAVNEFKLKNYQKALSLFDSFIEKVPDYYAAYEMRAFCHFFTKSYQNSIHDINQIVKHGGTLKGNVVNLRGVNYQNLGKKAEACTDYEKAMKMGDKDGTNNYNKFCKVPASPKPKVVNNTPIRVF
jgi:tetratricopeptide (TPR) repeat protein